MENSPPGALKSPENPAIPDYYYDLVLNPPSEPIDIRPKKNPLLQSTIFADFLRQDKRQQCGQKYQ
jgi:hypothetical protein